MGMGHGHEGRLKQWQGDLRMSREAAHCSCKARQGKASGRDKARDSHWAPPLDGM
jgi:hypothetical protein